MAIICTPDAPTESNLLQLSLVVGASVNTCVLRNKRHWTYRHGALVVAVCTPNLLLWLLSLVLRALRVPPVRAVPTNKQSTSTCSSTRSTEPQNTWRAHDSVSNKPRNTVLRVGFAKSKEHQNNANTRSTGTSKAASTRSTSSVFFVVQNLELLYIL